MYIKRKEIHIFTSVSDHHQPNINDEISMIFRRLSVQMNFGEKNKLIQCKT